MYSADRFPGDVPVQLICGICTEIVTDPLQCATCEHVFCSHCLQTWQQGCPNKCPDRVFSKAPRILQRIIDDLRLKCSGIGCDHVTRLADMQTHEAQCRYLQRKCDNPGCDRKRKGPGCCSRACRDALRLKDCIETSTSSETVLRHVTRVLRKWQRRCYILRHKRKGTS